MKTLLFALALSAFSLCANVEAQTNGLLVFEVDRDNWHTQGTEVKQRFKVPLTEEFMAQFKNLPNHNSSGTEFCCMGGEAKSAVGSTRFIWWIRRTEDNRWAINMWGQGVETINGVKVASMNPKTSQCMTIKRIEDLDMTYQVSYLNNFDGMNVSFKAKYMPAKEIDADGPIPNAPVKKTDQSELFKGDDPSKFPLELRCMFQEG
jgi:hypothetical protein